MTLRAWVLALLPAVLAGFLVVSTARQVRFMAHKDEGVYLYYASHIAEQGPAAFKGLTKTYLADERLHRYPPPFRLTTVGLQGLSVRLMGKSFRSLQAVSLGSFLLLLVLFFFGLRRLFDEKTAFLAALLLSVSPLYLGLARRALSDSLVAALAVLCLLWFIRLLTSKKPSSRQSVGLAFLYMAAFLAREGNFLLVPLSLALAGFHWIWTRRRPPVLLLCAVSVFPLVWALSAVVLVCGGWEPFRQAFLANFHSVDNNPYALQFGSGPWFRYLVDFLLISPATTLFYLVWIGCLIAGGEREEGWVLWALVPVLFLLLSAPFTKNVRYALMLEAPIRLGAAGLLRKQKPFYLALAVAGLLFLDGLAFCDLFVSSNLYDPVTVNLLALRGFLPR